jgi:hypothetical protein
LKKELKGNYQHGFGNMRRSKVSKAVTFKEKELRKTKIAINWGEKNQM